MSSDQFSLPRRDLLRGAGTMMALATVAGTASTAAAHDHAPAPAAKLPYTPERGTDDFPRPRFRHMNDEAWREVRAQDHSGKRVSAYEKWLEFLPRLLSFVGIWDPGMIIAQHGHMCMNTIFILEGSMTCGGVLCTKGMHITLDVGVPYGPNITGPDGCLVLEVMTGDVTPWFADNDGFAALKKARGIVQIPPPPQTYPKGAFAED